MAEVTNELLYDVLKSVQARLSNVDEKLDALTGRIGSVSLQLSAVRTDNEANHHDVGTIYQTLGQIDGRLIRIEKRLEIIDEPAE